MTIFNSIILCLFMAQMVIFLIVMNRYERRQKTLYDQKMAEKDIVSPGTIVEESSSELLALSHAVEIRSAGIEIVYLKAFRGFQIQLRDEEVWRSVRITREAFYDSPVLRQKVLEELFTQFDKMKNESRES